MSRYQRDCHVCLGSKVDIGPCSIGGLQRRMAKGLQIKPDGRHWLGNLSTSHCATVEHPIVIRSVLLIIIVAGLSVPNLVCAQTPPSSTEMPMTGMKPDRTVADKAGRQMMRGERSGAQEKAL